MEPTKDTCVTQAAASIRSARSGKHEASDVKIFGANDDIEEDARHDAVFGDIQEDGPNYRGLSTTGAAVLMLKANVGLGVLSIPFVFMSVGLIPGIMLIIIMQGMVTWSAYELGNFKLNHRDCYSIPDVGHLLFGKWGENAGALIFVSKMIFSFASGMMAVVTALNAVSMHATCTAVWGIIVAGMGWALISIQTLHHIKWLGWAGMISIIAALMTMVISVGVQDRPALAPAPPLPWVKDVKLFASPGFGEAMRSVCSVLFSVAATPTYFGVISEMKDPHHYRRAMYPVQIIVILLYIVMGSVVYAYCGKYVASPALGSAGVLMKRVCYGLAIPGLTATLVLYSHMGAKYMFIRLLRGSEHLTKNSFKHWWVWLSCTFFIALIGYIIGSAIPVFDKMISFVGALLSPWVAIIPYGMMWLHDNVRGRKWSDLSWRKKLHAGWAVFMIVAGMFLMVAGMFGAVESLMKPTASSRPWSCADNSGSVK